MAINHPGKVSYMQIPALDAQVSARFYSEVFGWTISGRPEHVSFEDASGELLGAFMTDRIPASEPGFLPYIYVQGIDEAVKRIARAGGTIVREPYPEGDLRVATFSDPAGNVLGIWQMGGE